MIFIFFRTNYAPILNMIKTRKSFFDSEFATILIDTFLVLSLNQIVCTAGRILHLFFLRSLNIDRTHTDEIRSNIPRTEKFLLFLFCEENIRFFGFNGRLICQAKCGAPGIKTDFIRQVQAFRLLLKAVIWLLKRSLTWLYRCGIRWPGDIIFLAKVKAALILFLCIWVLVRNL